MLSAEQKLAKIADICDHPGAFHWQGRDMARVIRNIIDDTSEPIPYSLSAADEPIRYELVHDAVYDDDQSRT